MAESEMSEADEMSLDESDATDTRAICQHEAAHAVVARALGIQVTHATAVDRPHVKTRYRTCDLEKVVAVDLAGVAMDTSPEAIAADMSNAQRNARQAVLVRHGLAEDAAMPPSLESEVTELLSRQRAAAADLVTEHRNSIDRVASALADGAPLNQTEIDAAMALVPENAATIADALITATQDFFETLMQITEAAGADAEDDFERACNVIAHQQKIACEVLRRYGFVPRRTNLD
jgi:hypothetical protein